MLRLRLKRVLVARNYALNGNGNSYWHILALSGFINNNNLVLTFHASFLHFAFLAVPLTSVPFSLIVSSRTQSSLLIMSPVQPEIATYSVDLPRNLPRDRCSRSRISGSSVSRTFPRSFEKKKTKDEQDSLGRDRGASFSRVGNSGERIIHRFSVCLYRGE